MIFFFFILLKISHISSYFSCLFSSLTFLLCELFVRLVLNSSVYHGIHRPSSARSLPKPAHLDKVNSNSLDCGIVDVEDRLPPKCRPSPNYKNYQELAAQAVWRPVRLPSLTSTPLSASPAPPWAEGAALAALPRSIPASLGCTVAWSPCLCRWVCLQQGAAWRSPGPDIRTEGRMVAGRQEAGSRSHSRQTGEASCLCSLELC